MIILSNSSHTSVTFRWSVSGCIRQCVPRTPYLSIPVAIKLLECINCVWLWGSSVRFLLHYDPLRHVNSPTRWRHQLETFSVLLAFCAVNSLVAGEFPAQRPVTRSFGVFIDLGLNQQLSKQWRRRWFKTPSCSLWSHCNASHKSLNSLYKCTQCTIW